MRHLDGKTNRRNGHNLLTGCPDYSSKSVDNTILRLRKKLIPLYRQGGLEKHKADLVTQSLQDLKDLQAVVALRLEGKNRRDISKEVGRSIIFVERAIKSLRPDLIRRCIRGNHLTHGDTIRSLFLSGLSKNEISKQLDISPESVRRATVGLVSPRSTRGKFDHHDMLDLRGQGLTLMQIADRLGCSWGAVQRVCKINENNFATGEFRDTETEDGDPQIIPRWRGIWCKE